MRILLLSNLYPNSVQRRKGLFVRERAKLLAGLLDARMDIVAPVPWFPFRNERFGRYADFSRVPLRDSFEGEDAWHPTYFTLPKLGDIFSPISYALSVRRLVRSAGLKFDLIDAHFFFPDGAAAILLGRWFRTPVVITGRGSDIHSMLDEAVAGPWIRWAARNADRLIAVSSGIRNRLEEITRGRTVSLVPNGVDTRRFVCYDSGRREEVRARLGLKGTVILSVGNLIELKGHDLAIHALARIPEATLVIVGSGPERGQLLTLSDTLGVADRVRLTGPLDQLELLEYYNAADTLVLCSSNEGSPNVILEALACGTPVVSTVEIDLPDECRKDVKLVDREVGAIVNALRKTDTAGQARAHIRQNAAALDWRSGHRRLLEPYAGLVPSAGIVK